MADFFNAALPWVVMGLFVAITTASMRPKEKNYEGDEEKDILRKK